MSLTIDDHALAERIAAEVVSQMPDPMETARSVNFTMARQLTIAYVSFASTVLITITIDAHLPRWPLYIFVAFLFVIAGFWNRRADQFRRDATDPYMLKHHQRRQMIRLVVLVPVVLLLVAAFGMAGYAAAMLRTPLTIVFILWVWDLLGLMRATGLAKAAEQASA